VLVVLDLLPDSPRQQNSEVVRRRHNGRAMPTPEPQGLRSGEVVVMAYDPRWPAHFETAASKLREALGPSALAVHHVGSTSVPGLCAKPILDILVSIADFDAGLELVPVLESLGYEFGPDDEIPDRHYFRRHIGTVRTHHLSLAEPASRHHEETLAFRDALRRNAQLATTYAELKLILAGAFPLDRPAYQEGKSEFIDDVLAGRL
jgi:GrpB-like predicted nucleotidyltransferase (UPF0157 family)